MGERQSVQPVHPLSSRVHDRGSVPVCPRAAGRGRRPGAAAVARCRSGPGSDGRSLPPLTRRLPSQPTPQGEIPGGWLGLLPPGPRSLRRGGIAAARGGSRADTGSAGCAGGERPASRRARGGLDGDAAQQPAGVSGTGVRTGDRIRRPAAEFAVPRQPARARLRHRARRRCESLCSGFDQARSGLLHAIRPRLSPRAQLRPAESKRPLLAGSVLLRPLPRAGARRRRGW